MKSVGLFAAKTQLSLLVDRAARGESILITKRGKPMATICPLATVHEARPGDFIREFRKKFAKSLPNLSVAEIVALKNADKK